MKDALTPFLRRAFWSVAYCSKMSKGLQSTCPICQLSVLTWLCCAALQAAGIYAIIRSSVFMPTLHYMNWSYKSPYFLQLSWPFLSWGTFILSKCQTFYPTLLFMASSPLFHVLNILFLCQVLSSASGGLDNKAINSDWNAPCNSLHWPYTLFAPYFVGVLSLLHTMEYYLLFNISLSILTSHYWHLVSKTDATTISSSEVNILSSPLISGRGKESSTYNSQFLCHNEMGCDIGPLRHTRDMKFDQQSEQ